MAKQRKVTSSTDVNIIVDCKDKIPKNQQAVFTFSAHPAKTTGKINKKDFVQIIASEGVAKSFVTRWATSRGLNSVYLVSVEKDNGE